MSARLWKQFVNVTISRTLHLKRSAKLEMEQGGAAPLKGNPHALVTIGRQPAPAAKTTTTTLTAAELLGRLITGNQGGGAAATYTLPTGALLEVSWRAQKPDLAVDDSFDFNVINISTVAAEDITIATATGWTLVGTMVVESNEATAQKGPSGQFRVRRTAENIFTLYRVA